VCPCCSFPTPADGDRAFDSATYTHTHVTALPPTHLRPAPPRTQRRTDFFPASRIQGTAASSCRPSHEHQRSRGKQPNINNALRCVSFCFVVCLPPLAPHTTSHLSCCFGHSRTPPPRPFRLSIVHRLVARGCKEGSIRLAAHWVPVALGVVWWWWLLLLLVAWCSLGPETVGRGLTVVVTPCVKEKKKEA